MEVKVKEKNQLLWKPKKRVSSFGGERKKDEEEPNSECFFEKVAGTQHKMRKMVWMGMFGSVVLGSFAGLGPGTTSGRKMEVPPKCVKYQQKTGERDGSVPRSRFSGTVEWTLCAKSRAFWRNDWLAKRGFRWGDRGSYRSRIGGMMDATCKSINSCSGTSSALQCSMFLLFSLPLPLPCRCTVPHCLTWRSPTSSHLEKQPIDPRLLT